jgi:hypothetical protein
MPLLILTGISLKSEFLSNLNSLIQISLNFSFKYYIRSRAAYFDLLWILYVDSNVEIHRENAQAGNPHSAPKYGILGVK